MSNVTTLHIFDFDGTLCHSPLPETGVHQWAEHHGKEWPYKGWWSKEESLDLDVFEIPVIEFVYNAWKEAKHSENAATFLLTSRLYKLKPHVLKVLDKHGIHFDGYYFKHFGKEKPDVVMDILKQYPNVKEVHVWDDRDKEIALYKQAMREFEKLGIKLMIHHVQVQAG